ncbi:lymphocyte antigen 6D isoform X2 [Erinaceus europaeus]|uniref:Lymphocyte antigen 6D isoform X2 n=1 Tax=Erinaceus europaeus TaxID=9365 RepID=A0ABM3XST5_ERIEU|nr:lymphocyte antigen 6D isoform X2 [Erinaceus europaeus]
MKTVLLLLVILAVAIGPAQALQCHVCQDSGNCKKTQTCPSSAKFCRTVTKETLSGNLVQKDCVDWCVPTKIQPNQITSGTEIVQCCQKDLCNHSLQNAASTRTPLASLLGLALSLLALLLAPGL